MAKKWLQTPRHLEEPEREYVAKRRKGLPSLISEAAAVAVQIPTRTIKVRRNDGGGVGVIYEVIVAEGQVVEGEIRDQDVDTSQITILAPGTVVADLGVANAEGRLVANDLLQPSLLRRRRPPPPKRKGGPGRGKKKVMFQQIAPDVNQAVAVNTTGVASDGTTIMVDSLGEMVTPSGLVDGEDDEGDEDEDGEIVEDDGEGDDDREEGELSDDDVNMQDHNSTFQPSTSIPPTSIPPVSTPPTFIPPLSIPPLTSVPLPSIPPDSRSSILPDIIQESTIENLPHTEIVRRPSVETNIIQPELEQVNNVTPMIPDLPQQIPSVMVDQSSLPAPLQVSQFHNDQLTNTVMEGICPPYQNLDDIAPVMEPFTPPIEKTFEPIFAAENTLPALNNLPDNHDQPYTSLPSYEPMTNTNSTSPDVDAATVPTPVNDALPLLPPVLESVGNGGIVEKPMQNEPTNIEDQIDSI